MLIGNSAGALLFILGNAYVSSFSLYPSSIYYIVGIFGLLNVIITIMLFMWKKWAFFVFIWLAIIVFIINISLGIGVLALLGLIGPIILYLLMRPKWNLFE